MYLGGAMAIPTWVGILRDIQVQLEVEDVPHVCLSLYNGITIRSSLAKWLGRHASRWVNYHLDLFKFQVPWAKYLIAHGGHKNTSVSGHLYFHVHD